MSIVAYKKASMTENITVFKEMMTNMLEETFENGKDRIELFHGALQSLQFEELVAIMKKQLDGSEELCGIVANYCNEAKTIREEEKLAAEKAKRRADRKAAKIAAAEKAAEAARKALEDAENSDSESETEDWAAIVDEEELEEKSPWVAATLAPASAVALQQQRMVATKPKRVIMSRNRYPEDHIVVTTNGEINDLVNEGMRLCRHNESCRYEGCGFVHTSFGMMCKEDGCGGCGKLHWPGNGHEHIVDNQDDYDQYIEGGWKPCKNVSNCTYTGCTFLHIRPGFECSKKVECFCEKVHRGICRAGRSCKALRVGKCSFIHA
jgi:hypothetical protein